MPTISGSPTNFNLTSTWTVAYNGSYYYIGTKPNTDTQSVTFNFSSIPAGTKIESAVLYATFGSPVTGAALRTVDGTSFNGSRNVTITPGGSNTFTFRFKANGSASSPTGTKSSTLSVSNVRIVVNEGQTGGGGDPSNPSGTYQSPQYVWFDNTSDAKPGESRTLKWTAGSAHAGRSVKGYDIHRGLTPGGVSYYKSVGNVLQTSVPSHTSNGASYYYRVLTIQDDNTYYMYSNAVGILKTAWTDTSPPSNLRPSPQFPEPGQTFTLSWDAGESGSNNALKGYKIELAESTDGPWTVIADNLSIRTHNTTSPAEHGGKYYYRGISIGTYSNGDPSALLEVISVAPATTGSLSPSTVPMDDESTISLALNNPNSSYGHVVTWSIGSKSIVDELAPGATASTIVVPIDWCEETPNSASGVATALLETFDGETKVGEASYTFQVTVPSSVVPSISALDRAVVDGYTGLYLRGISSVQLSVTASGTLGSTIPSGGYSLFGAGNSGTTNPWTTPVFNTVGDNNVTAVVIDSRGRSATRTETVHVVDYSWPIISAVSARRCLEDGTLNDDGTYVKVKATLTVTSLSGNNPIASALVEYRKRGTVEWVLGTASIISNTDIVVGIGNIAISDAYEVRVSLTDTVGKTTLHTSIVSPSTRLYDFRTDRAGIGRVAGDVTKQLLVPDNWTTNIDADKLDGYDATAFLGASAKAVDSDKLEGSTLAQVISACLLASYPVGSIYESTENTSPATLFGGTWSALPTGKFLRIGTGGTTGGSDTHDHTTGAVALTVSQMPSHTHKAKSPTTGTDGGVKSGFDVWRTGGEFSADYMIENTGGGDTHEHGNTGSSSNVPAYYEVYAWRRTA